MIQIIASIYDLASISWALRHPRPAGLPRVWIPITPRATSLQILSCWLLRTTISARALTPPKEWMQARHSRKAFKLPYYAELGPANR